MSKLFLRVLRPTRKGMRSDYNGSRSNPEEGSAVSERYYMVWNEYRNSKHDTAYESNAFTAAFDFLKDTISGKVKFEMKENDVIEVSHLQGIYKNSVTYFNYRKDYLFDDQIFFSEKVHDGISKEAGLFESMLKNGEEGLKQYEAYIKNRKVERSKFW